MTEERKPYQRHDPDMDLPAGRTCGDCIHFYRCNMMFGHIAADESCDWAPSRFRLHAGKIEYESWRAAPGA